MFLLLEELGVDVFLLDTLLFAFRIVVVFGVEALPEEANVTLGAYLKGVTSNKGKLKFLTIRHVDHVDKI